MVKGINLGMKNMIENYCFCCLVTGTNKCIHNDHGHRLAIVDIRGTIVL